MGIYGRFGSLIGLAGAIVSRVLAAYNGGILSSPGSSTIILSTKRNNSFLNLVDDTEYV